MDKDLSKTLAILGLKIGKGQESRMLTVLRAVLDVSEDTDDAITFGEIYDALQREKDFHASKAWVHRILKNLVDLKIIRVESGESTRRRYIGNIETVVSGLEKLKNDIEQGYKNEIDKLSKQMEEVSAIDCGSVGQNLVEVLTGKSQKLSSRFISGMEELHRVLHDYIHAPAGKNDIIRSTMSWGGPWVQSPEKRLQKYLESAKRGADVRWIVDAKVLLTEILPENFSVEELAGIFSEFAKLEQAGLKFEVRLVNGGMAYNQSSLNDEALALIITEDPPTATFVTRDFNKELIDTVIRSFDTLWKKGVSMTKATPQELKKMGFAESVFMTKVFQKIAEK